MSTGRSEPAPAAPCFALTLGLCHELLMLAADKSVLLEEYASEMITQEVMHLNEVYKTIHKTGDVEVFKG